MEVERLGDALTYVCQVCGETSDKPPRSKWGASEVPYDKAADQFPRVVGRLQTPPCAGGVCHSNGWTGP